MERATKPDKRRLPRLDVVVLVALLAVVVVSAGCGGPEETSPAEEEAAAPVSPAAAAGEKEAMSDKTTMRLTSTAFERGGTIPGRYSCDGDDISPPLAWSGLPAGTGSLALIMDDPDAPGRTWDHWLIYNLDPALGGLPEGAGSEAPDGAAPNGALLGRNSWRRNDYGGPCPPRGEHRYFFRLYALDDPLDLPAEADKGALLAAMEGRVLGQAELMGRYQR